LPPNMEQKKAMRTERLTPMLIKILTMVHSYQVTNNCDSVHPDKDIHMTYSERANLQKLRYWGLLAKAGDGKWLVTTNGGKFMRHELAVSKEIYVADNQIVGKSEQKVYFNGVDLTEEPFMLVTKDYQEQKQPTLGLNVISNRYRVG
jgi:hypothetical protein